MVTTFRRNVGRGHWYALDGRKVPSVSSVLGAWPKNLHGAAAREAAIYAVEALDQLTDLVEAGRAKEAQKLIATAHVRAWGAKATRGTNVHTLVARLLAGDELDVPDELAGYVDGYLDWWEYHQPGDPVWEKPCFSRRYCYAGTFDLIARVRGAYRVIDVKTGSAVWPEAALQLAAYAATDFYLHPSGVEVPMPPVEGGLVLHLPGDGTWVEYPVTAEALRGAHTVFLHLAQVSQAHKESALGWLGQPTFRGES